MQRTCAHPLGSGQGSLSDFRHNSGDADNADEPTFEGQCARWQCVAGGLNMTD